jgi:hypothetical protein
MLTYAERQVALWDVSALLREVARRGVTYADVC